MSTIKTIHRGILPSPCLTAMYSVGLEVREFETPKHWMGLGCNKQSKTEQAPVPKDAHKALSKLYFRKLGLFVE